MVARITRIQSPLKDRIVLNINIKKSKLFKTSYSCNLNTKASNRSGGGGEGLLS
jgi:hypothetical protein